MKHVKTLNKANLKETAAKAAAASARHPASLLARPPAQLPTRNASTQNKVTPNKGSTEMDRGSNAVPIVLSMHKGRERNKKCYTVFN